jgi:hypothetical protein
MIGLDQEDIPINITPVEEVVPPPDASRRSTISMNANNTTVDRDYELPLAVTDADNQTPLLGDDHHKPALSNVLIDKGQCCILL